MMICNRIFDLNVDSIKASLVQKALRFMIADRILTVL
jgi:hypothetical protein